MFGSQEKVDNGNRIGTLYTHTTLKCMSKTASIDQILIDLHKYLSSQNHFKWILIEITTKRPIKIMY